MPTPGRYDVEVGPSLGKALKARNGIKMNSKMPARDFYAFRCQLPSPPLPLSASLALT